MLNEYESIALEFVLVTSQMIQPLVAVVPVLLSISAGRAALLLPGSTGVGVEVTPPLLVTVVTRVASETSVQPALLVPGAGGLEVTSEHPTEEFGDCAQTSAKIMAPGGTLLTITASLVP